MNPISPLFPRQPVPDLRVPTLDGDTWSVRERSPENFSLIVVYRGLHCPICKVYLRELDRHHDDLAKHGVEVIALSGDTEERAQRTKEEWKIDRTTIGYGLDLDTARDWGLYISSGIGETSMGIEEPEHFVEPGLFLVRPDGTLYFGSVQTMPFARPAIADVAKAIGFVLEKDYPARGEVTDGDTRQAAE